MEKREGKVKRAVRAIHKAEHYVVMKVATMAHLAYYGLVATEAHGSYRYAAGVVGVVLLVEAFAGKGGEE